MPRKTAGAAGAAVAVLAVIVVIAAVLIHLHAVQAAQQQQDASLRATADHVAPLVVQHKQDYAGATFVDALHIYLFGLQATLTKHRASLTPGNQFVQVQVYDPATTPPQALVLNAPGHPMTPLDIPLITRVFQSGQPQYTTLSANGQTLRAYVRPLALPDVFSQQSVVQVLEVLAPQAG